MANDFGIRIVMDENGTSGVTSDQVADIVQKVIQLLSAETLAITNATAYAVGDRTYNAVLSLNTITAADYAIEVLVASTVSGDKKAKLLAKIIQGLSNYTLALVLNTTYAAGTTSTNQNTITVT